MDKCVECGAFAPVPPLCINCMLSMTDDEYRKYVHLHNIKAALEDDITAHCDYCDAVLDAGGVCPNCGKVGLG